MAKDHRPAPGRPGTARSRLTASLRLRLTLWVVIIFMVIQFTLGLVFMLYQQAAIGRMFDDRLRQHANLVRSDVAASLGDMSDMHLRAIMRRRMGPSLHEEVFVKVFAADGTLLAASHDARLGLPLDAVRQAARASGAHVVRFPLRRDADAGSRVSTDARALLLPIEAHDGAPHVLLCAVDGSEADRMLGVSLRVLLVALPIGLVSALVSGWFIAGIAVAPLYELGRMARRLSPESIGRTLGESTNSTEVADLQRELENARRRIEQGFMAQERFMSNVSHELKTPIAVLLTELQTLKINDADPEVRDFVRSVEQEMRKLGRLVDSFLLLTKVREGKSRTRLERVQINDLVLDAVGRSASMATQHRVRIEPSLLCDEDQVDLAVVGEDALLCTMLDNLVRNAVRFSPAEGTVFIEPRPTADAPGESPNADRWIQISVRDQGPGIPPELVDRVFDRFAQAKSEERRGRGHGLGLEIAQGIAELHGGKISVRNLPGGGCEFTVSLPLAAEGVDPAPLGDGSSLAR